jgi:hypothetical protein
VKDNSGYCDFPWEIGCEVTDNSGYCDFPRFELKFREAKVLLKPSRIKLKYLEVLEKG